MRKNGYFGNFGGQFVPELLMPALYELEETFKIFKDDNDFQEDLASLLKNFSGRPTPLFYAKNLSEYAGGASIFLKREDLNHTGSHKLNNCLGQALLAKKMGKTRIIAETGAGQHGVATATACALLNLDCTVYMGAEDIKRQELNVFRMKVLGADVVPVHSGSKTLKDAVNEALRAWITQLHDTHYIIGSVVGPHPFPLIVREFQSIIGKEAYQQLNAVPDYVVACVGGGSNAMGIFHAFRHTGAKLIGVEAGGQGSIPGQNAASVCHGDIGVFHGQKSYFVQNKQGQITETHSIAAGLDYPGTGPEHAHLFETGRAEYTTVSDNEALDAFVILSKIEGIIPALESSHAIAYAIKLAKTRSKEESILISLSGRGDKDVSTVLKGLK